MRYLYTIYPEAKQKLEHSGIMERIKEAHSKYEIGTLGYVSLSDIPDYIKDLKERKFVGKLIQSENSGLINKLNKVFEDPEQKHWKINKAEGTITENVEPEDFLLMSGWWTSQILKPEEFCDYKKNGFENISDFFGTIGAAANNEFHDSSYRRGYRWYRQLADGHSKDKILINELTGDHNSDFVMNQTDITPYETFDPIGNKVSYRPVLRSDNGGIRAYHSVEGNFLISVLKYIEQTKIKPKLLEDKAAGLIEWTKSLGQHGGTCAEHFGGFDESPMLFFSCFDMDIPILNKNFETKEHTHYGVGTSGQGFYATYIHPNKTDLVYSASGNAKKEIHAHFTPEDSDNLLKGISYQCAAGLGRTSANQIVSILEYYFSPKMKEDLEKSMKEFRK